jgi:hypothetical protein
MVLLDVVGTAGRVGGVSFHIIAKSRGYTGGQAKPSARCARDHRN